MFSFNPYQQRCKTGLSLISKSGWRQREVKYMSNLHSKNTAGQWSKPRWSDSRVGPFTKAMTTFPPHFRHTSKFSPPHFQIQPSWAQQCFKCSKWMTIWFIDQIRTLLKAKRDSINNCAKTEANWNCPWHIGEHSPLNYEKSVHVIKRVWMIKEDFSKSHVSLALGRKGIPSTLLWVWANPLLLENTKPLSASSAVPDAKIIAENKADKVIALLKFTVW